MNFEERLWAAALDPDALPMHWEACRGDLAALNAISDWHGERADQLRGGKQEDMSRTHRMLGWGYGLLATEFAAAAANIRNIDNLVNVFQSHPYGICHSWGRKKTALTRAQAWIDATGFPLKVMTSETYAGRSWHLRRSLRLEPQAVVFVVPFDGTWHRTTEKALAGFLARSFGPVQVFSYRLDTDFHANLAARTIL